MYRYYQTKEKGKWSPLRDSDQSVKTALEEGARKVTVLAVSEVVDEYTVKDQLSYKGPLYFDIDCKDDLYMAIKSAKELLAKLLKFGVHKDCVAAYCSGSKGLHLMVDSRSFSTGRAIKGLPFIYKAMAKALYVFGLDFQVYSGGRGNSWRVVNLQRDDGNFRVCISHEELEVLTPETYKEYVKGPRLEQEFPAKVEAGHALLLSSLYEKCKQEVQKQRKDFSKNQKAALDDNLLEDIKGTPPACVEALLDGKVKTELNFNEVVLQLAAYLSSTGATESVINSMSSRLSEKMSSSQYSSSRERYQHAIGLVHYCKASAGAYKFACPAIKRVLTVNPCEGCSVNSRKTEDQLAAEEGDIGISARSDGYYAIGGETDRRISTFTLDIIDFHAEQQQDGSIDRRTGFKALVNSKGLNCSDRAEIFMSEDMWNSKSALIHELNGLGALAFLGTDVDVQRVKHYVFSQQGSSDAGQITAVYTAGIIAQKVGKQELMVYIEPSGSINQVKVQNTHYLNSNILCPPKLLEEGMPSPGDHEMAAAVDSMLKINSKLNMAIIIGWHTAAHFKTHFVRQYNQFPFLNLWGPAGCGKTQTAVQMSFLNGCDYTADDSPMNVYEATQWALIDFCSTTTTSPRILDEANESKMKGKYISFSEIVKSAWGNQTVTRGTLRKSGSSGRGRTGAQTVSIPISSPIIALSEQSLTMPALQQRGIQAFLTRESRANKECTAAFMAMKKYRGKLKSLGKAMMVHALTSPSAYVKGHIDKYIGDVPEELEDRPRYSYAVIMSGLEIFREVCNEFGLDVDSRINELSQALKNHLKESVEEIVMEKSRTEIDLILQDMAVMASLTQSGMSKELVEDVHYMVHNNKLVLDYRTAFPLYTQYCARNRKDVVIRDIRQFHALIRQEPYFEQEGMVVGFLNRPTMVLSKSGMMDKGIDVSMFSLSSEIHN